MPMSFGALLGGIVTSVGTSPNIIVSRVREQLLGQPYNMFDFTPVGAGIAIAGFLFLVFGWRLLPQNRQGAASMDAAFNLEGYTTEVTVPETSPAAGLTVKALEDLGENEIEVIAVLRGPTRRYDRRAIARSNPATFLPCRRSTASWHWRNWSSRARARATRSIHRPTRSA